MTTKTCTQCGEEKPLDEFYSYWHKRAEKTYYQSQCKPCYYKLQRVYRQKHRTVVAERTRRRDLKALYGITLEQYDEMFERQNGVCAICKEPEKRRANMDVDHDHGTGEVRGLLCNRCNLLLGKIGDDLFIAKQIVAYLSKALAG